MTRQQGGGRPATETTDAERVVVEQTLRWNETLEIYKRAPEELLYDLLGVEQLWEKQVEILHSVLNNPRTAVPSGHNLGKTFLSGAIPLCGC
jgi:hypothetical protein